MVTLGYFLSSEDRDPRELVDAAVRAEQAGFRTAWISDHYHPWTDAQGESGFVWSTLGAIAQATSELLDRMEAKYPDEWLKISVDLHSCGLSAQGWTAISVGTYLLLSTILGPCPWRCSFDWNLPSY